jgi:hypothetical protein
MLTSIECLAHADLIDALARRSATPRERHGYAETADGWRAVARLAAAQEVWESITQFDEPN